MTDAALLEQELTTFEAHREELLAAAAGKYALVHENDLVGTYNDEKDAIAEGYRRFGNVAFLVKRITQIEQPASFVNNHLGL